MSRKKVSSTHLLLLTAPSILIFLFAKVLLKGTMLLSLSLSRRLSYLVLLLPSYCTGRQWSWKNQFDGAGEWRSAFFSSSFFPLFTLHVKYVNNKFTMQTKSTIGSDFLSKEIELRGRPVTLQIWDTAGQERFQSLGTSFYRGSDGVVFVFDVGRPETFKALGQWRDAFLIQAGIADAKTFPMLVLANKVDIEDRKVSQKEAKDWCAAQGLEYMETSAKEALNVSKAFESLADSVIENLPDEEMSYETVDLSQKQAAKKDEPCSC